MALSTHIKGPAFTNNLAPRIMRSLKRAKENALDVIFIILIIGSFFANIKLILALFIILYFADRWEVKKLFIKQEQIYGERNKNTRGETGGKKGKAGV